MAPFQLWPSQGEPTPLDELQVLIMGNKSIDGLYTYANWPRYNVGSGFPALPIAFLCRDNYEVRMLQPLRPFFQSMNGLSTAQLFEAIDRLKTFPTLQQALASVRKFYPVLNGNGGRECIATTWANARPFLVDQTNPKMKRCDDAASALKYMFARGNDIHVVAERTQEYEAFQVALNALSLDDVVQPQTPKKTVRSVMSPSSETGSASPSKHASSARRKVAGKDALPSLVPVEVPDSEDEDKAHVSSPDRRDRKGKATARPVGSERSRREARGSPSGGGNSLPAGPSKCASTPARRDVAPFIYMNMRDARGQITFASVSPPPVLYGERVPSLGAEADNFVDRWGFDNSTVLHIYNTHVQSTSRDEFACILATSTLALQEARWLWDVIRLPADRTTRARDFARD
ncbi:hypothetical protein BDW22DRAFT_1426054 [Trametopsis cervina]|nr:hypothetical protein BDW22DRAFT_1426054 [Trametopsis cervina]